MKKVEIYKQKISLDNPFITGSSFIKEKFVYLYFDPISENIVELPYSPSMGNLDNFLVPGPKLSKICSWLLFDSTHLKIPEKFNIKIIKTLSIGEDIYENVNDKINTILKIKAGPFQIDELIEHAQKLTTKDQNWIVDFNKSLSLKDFNYFSSKVNLKKCLGIEQPFPPGMITKEICQNFPIIFDEEMNNISLQEIIEYTPSYVVLKYWRYSYLDFIRLQNWLIDNQVEFMIGNMIQGEIANYLSDHLNKFSTLQYQVSTNNFFQNEKFKNLEIINNSIFVKSIYL